MENFTMKVNELVGKFYSSISPDIKFSSDPMIKLGMFASFLYWHKEGKLTKTENHKGEHAICTFDLSYMSVTNQPTWEKWQKKGVLSESLVAKPDSSEAGCAAEAFRAYFEKHINEIYVFDVFDLLQRMNPTTEEYKQLLACSIDYSRCVSIPKEVTDLSKALIGNDIQSVCDPTCHSVNIVEAFDAETKVACTEDKLQYNYHILYDYLIEANTIITSAAPQGEYDAIVSMPPFFDRNQEKNNLQKVVEFFVNQTNAHGKAFIYVPVGFLYRRDFKEVRKSLIEANYIDTIIEFPNRILTATGIDTIAICLKKERTESGIAFIDAKAMVTKKNKYLNTIDVEAILSAISAAQDERKKLVSRDKIAANDIDLTSALYNEERKEIPTGYEEVRLSDLLVPLRGVAMEADENLPVVNPIHLSEDWFKSPLNISELPKQSEIEVSTEMLRQYRKSTSAALFISRSVKFKTAYCEASPTQPVLYGPNIMVYSVNTDRVSVKYLTHEMNKIADQFYQGSAIGLLRKDLLLNATILVPSKSEQDLIVTVAEAEAKKAIAKENGLQEYIEEQKRQYIGEVRLRKHDMKPHLKQVIDASELIKFYLEKKKTLGEYDEDILRNAVKIVESTKKLNEMLDHLCDEDAFGNPEDINLNAYLSSLQKTNAQGIKLTYTCDETTFAANAMERDNLITSIARKDLDRLVDNIIQNAQRHGFTKEGKEYYIHVSLSFDNEKKMYLVDFRNNGNPLPEGLDKASYGMRGEKAGKTGGTGQGGYIVKSITEHFGGDYDVFTDKEETVIRIYLPIKQD